MPRTSWPSALARSTTARIAALRPGASPPPVRTPMRTQLALRGPLLPLERLVELLGGPRPHEGKDLSEPARPAIGLERVLHREGFSKLIVREDPLLDQVLAEALDRGRVAEQPAKRVDE